MKDLIPLFVTLGALATVLANIAIWSPRSMMVKVAALAATAAFLPVAYASLSAMLSRPKPIEMEWSHQQLAEASVLGARMEENKAIFVWLEMDGVDEPRAYVLPWSKEMAKQLHGAQRLAEQSGTEVRMRMPFENSLDEQEQIFYAAPIPPAAEKEDNQQNALQFQHSPIAPSGSAN